jgi:hypothetical protein
MAIHLLETLSSLSARKPTFAMKKPSVCPIVLQVEAKPTYHAHDHNSGIAT